MIPHQDELLRVHFILDGDCRFATQQLLPEERVDDDLRAQLAELARGRGIVGGKNVMSADLGFEAFDLLA